MRVTRIIKIKEKKRKEKKGKREGDIITV